MKFDTHSEDGEGLDVASGGDVRSSAQIDEGTASVDGALGAIRHSLVNEILLVLAVLEHLEELLLGHLKTLKGLLLLDDIGREGVKRLLVLVGDSLTVALFISTLYLLAVASKRTHPSMFAMS